MAIKGLGGGKEFVLSSLELSVICSFRLPLPNEKKTQNKTKTYSIDQKALPVQRRAFKNKAHFVSVLLECHTPIGFQEQPKILSWEHAELSTSSPAVEQHSGNSGNYHLSKILRYYEKKSWSGDMKSGATADVHVHLFFDISWKQQPWPCNPPSPEPLQKSVWLYPEDFWGESEWLPEWEEL